jgi:DNA-binding response OmpR family regulator
MRVLLIEPDTLLGKAYQTALTRAGHQVMWQRSAQAAVDAADKTPLDVVVVELQLPGHGGVEFLYEFRSYPEWQRVPVVLHTFVPQQHLPTRQFAALGVAAYLYKPAASLRHLVRAVNTVLPVQMP